MSSDESSEGTLAQMDQFDIGQIKAHMEHGLNATEIARRVKKQDGESTWTDRAVEYKMKQLKKRPYWRGLGRLVLEQHVRPQRPLTNNLHERS